MAEAEEAVAESPKAKVSIESFLEKIYNCKTCEGVDELEKFYKKRYKEVNISDSEDIQIRDALRGRKEEIKAEIEAAKEQGEAEEL